MEGLSMGHWDVQNIGDAMYRKCFPTLYSKNYQSPGDYSITLFDINSTGIYDYPYYAYGLIGSPRAAQSETYGDVQVMAMIKVWEGVIQSTFEFSNGKATEWA